MSLRGMNAVNDKAISEIAQFIPSDVTGFASAFASQHGFASLAMTTNGAITPKPLFYLTRIVLFCIIMSYLVVNCNLVRRRREKVNKTLQLQILGVSDHAE